MMIQDLANIQPIYTHPSRYLSRGIYTPVAIVLHEVNDTLSALDYTSGTNLINALKPTAHRSYHYAVGDDAVHSYVTTDLAARAIADDEVLYGWSVQAGYPGTDPDLYTLNIAVIIGEGTGGDNECIPCCGRAYSVIGMWNLRRLIHQLAELYEIDVSGDNLWLHGDELCDICLEDLRIPPPIITPGEEDWLCDRLAELPPGTDPNPSLVGNDCHVYPASDLICDILAGLPVSEDPPEFLVGSDCQLYAPAEIPEPTCDVLSGLPEGANPQPRMCNTMVVSPDCEIYPLDDGDWEIYTDGGGVCQTGRQTPGSIASGDYALAGGIGNVAQGQYAAIAGGSANSATGARAAIAGGSGNVASGDRTAIGGGSGNVAGGEYAVIGGGQASSADGDNSTIGGGNNNSSSGTNSTIAGGTANEASGENSTVAGGIANAAKGDHSTVSGGIDNFATGPDSHAEGNTTLASGDASHSEGQDTIAAGDKSHAEGNGSIASGADSHAQNNQTTASGNQSHAEGYLSTASGNKSHAEGNHTVASGPNSHAQGVDTQSIAGATHSEGVDTIASGYASHAGGVGTTAIGVGAIATGNGSIATGNWSEATGYQTLAYGEGSKAQGWRTTADGLNSNARGEDTYTTSAARNSEASGKESITSHQSEHASAGGMFETAGDAQRRIFHLKNEFPHDIEGWYALATFGEAPGIYLTPGAVFNLRVQVVGTTADAAQRWGYNIEAVVSQPGLIPASLVVDAFTVTTLFESDAQYDAQVFADTTTGRVLVQVGRFGGGTAYDVRWFATAEVAQVIWAT